jgi:nucleotide-binding universal stress UspA family protein
MVSSNILVATEPTNEGKHIWQVASRVAKHQDAQPHALNVVEPAVAIYADLNFTPLAECATDWQRELLAANRKYLARVAPCIDENLTVIEGYPSQEISKAAEKLDANLIVMGVHNRRGLKRLLGSTTHTVLNSSDRDVLAVHPDGKLNGYKRVVVAVDTTDLIDTVLTRAKEFAEGADLVKIVSVIIPLTKVFAAPEAGHGLDWSFAELAEDIRKETRSKVTEAAQRHAFEADAVDLRGGDPRDEIVAAAEEYDADLIVIGSNKRNALNRLLLGSTARGVLNHTPCDVLVCR